MRHRILIVDDEPAVLGSLTKCPRMAGYQVDGASELEEAQALLSYIPYSIVLTDLRLSDLKGSEGLEILERVRWCSPWSKVVVMTGYGSRRLREACKEIGAAAYLEKPVSLKKVEQVISRLLDEKDPRPWVETPRVEARSGRLVSSSGERVSQSGSTEGV